MIGWAAWGLAQTARAGDYDAELAVDALHATSTTEDPEAGADPSLSATELGIRLRGTVEAGRVLGAVDYQGREPVAGAFPTLPNRLLYRAEAVVTVVDESLDVGVGRFVAPSVVFLPVDGVHVDLTPQLGDLGELRFTLFGGRRGITTARTSLGFDTFLPAVGGSAGLFADRGSVELQAAYAEDQAVLGAVGGADEPGELFTEAYGALSGSARGWLRPIPAVTVGGSATMAQRATYVLAPVGIDPTIEVQAADLFQALVYLSLRPSDDVRIQADVLHQEATLSAGTVESDPPGADVPLIDPTFQDQRVSAAIRVADLAWLRPDVRLRLRRDITELRWGGGIDVDRLGIPGLFVRGMASVDTFFGDSAIDPPAGAPPTFDGGSPIDRLLWSGSAGWTHGFPARPLGAGLSGGSDSLELEAGASFTDRSLAPVSSRSHAATESIDLSPFVLEAENVVFGRGFWTNRRFFGGADVEVSVLDPEVRAFVQFGVLTEGSW
ncbi:MAG: hypothetical protein ABMB14_12405 [Myxococcota bacterium]